MLCKCINNRDMLCYFNYNITNVTNVRDITNVTNVTDIICDDFMLKSPKMAMSQAEQLGW